MNFADNEVRIDILPDRLRIRTIAQPGDIMNALREAGFEKAISTPEGDVEVLDSNDAVKVFLALGIAPEGCIQIGATCVHGLPVGTIATGKQGLGRTRA